MKNEIDIQIIKDDLADLAKTFGKTKVAKEAHLNKLQELGFSEEDCTNNALVVASVFANAVQGDMKAVEKWQELTATNAQEKEDDDAITEIITNRESDGKPGAVRKIRA